MTIKPNGNPSIGPIFDIRVDANARDAASTFIGEASTFTAVRVSDTRFELWLHDEHVPGGILINPLPSAPSNYNNVTMTLGAGNTLVITQANGNVVTEDLSPLLGPDVHLASLTLVGNTLVATDTDANTFPVDLSTLAFVDQVQLVGNNLVFDFGDGSQTTIDLSSYVNLPADGVINSFTLSGTVATIGTTTGGSFPLDMSSLNETLADNGDGTYTFNDGEGNLVLVNTAKASAATAAGVDNFGNAYAIGDTIVTFADGQVLAHSPAAAPTPQLETQLDTATVEAATAIFDVDSTGLDLQLAAPGIVNLREKDWVNLGLGVYGVTQTLTVFPGVTKITAQVVGGGGGSIGCPTTLAVGEQYATPGGGAGSSGVTDIYDAATLLITIGAGGLPAANGGVVTGVNYHTGNAGGTTSIAVTATNSGAPAPGLVLYSEGGYPGDYWSPYTNYRGTVRHADNAHTTALAGIFGASTTLRGEYGQASLSVGSNGGGQQMASAGHGGTSAFGLGGGGHNGASSGWTGSGLGGDPSTLGLNGVGGGAGGCIGRNGNTSGSAGVSGAPGLVTLTFWGRS